MDFDIIKRQDDEKQMGSIFFIIMFTYSHIFLHLSFPCFTKLMHIKKPIYFKLMKSRWGQSFSSKCSHKNLHSSFPCVVKLLYRE